MSRRSSLTSFSQPPGQWRDYRRDDSRAGRQSLPGKIDLGAPLWKTRLGGGYQEVEPLGDGSGDVLLADAGGIQRLALNGEGYRWKSKAFGAHWITGVYDLDGDGRLEIVTSNGREILILSAEDGEILWRYVVGPPFSYGTYATMFQVHRFFPSSPGMQILVPCFSLKEVLMFDCSEGAERTRLQHRLWMNDGYHPSITIGDVNRDGSDEIVIARLGGLYVFDPTTGEMISQTQWQSDAERRRNYGHFELSDIDGDGDLEAVILSDKVSRHIAVLDNDGHGQFSPLWDRFIEHIYPTDTTELRYTSHSVSDLSGDGRAEIVVSLYNTRGDGRWYTEVLNAVTGETLQEFPDEYLRGIVRRDDGGVLVATSHEGRRRSVQCYAPLVLRSTDQSSGTPTSELQIVWQHPHARFAERTMHTGGRTSEFKPDVFAEHEIWSLGDEELLIQTEEDATFGLARLGLSTLTLTATSIHLPRAFRVAQTTAEGLVLSRVDGDLYLLKDPEEGPELLARTGFHLTPEAHIAARPGSIPTVIPGGLEGRNAVTAPDFSLRIHGFTSPVPSEGLDTGLHISPVRMPSSAHSATEPQPLWSIPGRSRIGYDGVFHAASIIETNAGLRMVAVDDEHLDHGRIGLYRLNGTLDRGFHFSRVPASSLGSRIGFYDWLFFEHSRGEALMASYYASSSMNSERTLAFLLETGEVLWQLESYGEGEHGRGIGPWGTSSMLTIDGRSVGCLCAKDTLCRIDLETGEFLETPRLLTEYTAQAMAAQGRLREQGLETWSTPEDPFTAYGTAIRVANGGREWLFIGGCFGGYGLIDARTLEAKWWHPQAFGGVMYKLPGIGDIDGDGALEIGQAYADGFFRLLDFETGALRAEIDLRAIGTDTATCDCNNDGRDEFVLGTSDGKLVILGWSGQELVTLAEAPVSEFRGAGDDGTPAGAGSPIAADVDGDGRAEILVTTAAGDLLCFGFRALDD